ncbi:MAG TPA: protease complex subunit PrcB family protein [Bacillota bacterium]|nr:protease complex subunit PrcB family protein [Bacillota bacterium]
MKSNINILCNKLLIVFCMLFVLAGCSAQAANSIIEGKDTPLQYEILNPPYMVQLNDLIHSLKPNGGVKSTQIGKDTLVVISLGQRSSAGYQILIDKVEEKNGKIVIHYSEKKPEGMAAMVITYPSLVVKITNSTLPVEAVQGK